MPKKPEDNEKEHPQGHDPESEPIDLERPFECIDCKKPGMVHYTEIVGKTITDTVMCNDCPVLHRRLYGLSNADIEGGIREGQAGLACGNCGTTLEAVRKGSPLGCNVCYEVFDEILLLELNQSGKIPARLTANKKSQTVHIGRSPGETQEISSSMRLLALNEALSETIKREDYEQAAWLRDQIKALTDSQPPIEEDKK